MRSIIIGIALVAVAVWLVAPPEISAAQQNRNQQKPTNQSSSALQKSRSLATPSLSPAIRSTQSSRASTGTQQMRNQLIQQIQNSRRPISMVPSGPSPSAPNRGLTAGQRNVPSFAGQNVPSVIRSQVQRAQNLNRRDVVVQRPDTVFHRPQTLPGTVPIDRVRNRAANFNNAATVNNRNSRGNNTIINQQIVNRTVNNTTINQNSNNRTINNNSRYRNPSPSSYYSKLHYHWQPNSWSRSYRPAFCNYNVRGVGIVGLGGLSVSYVNPFFVSTNVGYAHGFDYSRPIAVPYSSYRETSRDMVLSERAIRRFDDARGVFRRGEYGRASELIDEAIALLPNDPALHQFRALTLFARQRYAEASSVLYSVFAVSSGWDVDTIVRLYDDPQTYLAQVADLERFVSEHPQSVDSQFLLAYHRAVTGDPVGAHQLLRNVRVAYPNDSVVRNIEESLVGG